MSILLSDVVKNLINAHPSHKVRIDELSSSVVYVGFARTADIVESDAKWKIAKLGRAGTKFKIDWATDGIFTSVWNDRSSYFTSGALANDWSISLDGVNDFLDFGDHYTFEINVAFSWSVWLKPTNTSAIRRLIGKSAQTADENGYRFFHNASGQLQSQLRSNSGGTVHTFTDLVLTAGAWNHVVFTFDGSSNQNGIKAYLNGTVSAVLPASAAMTGSFANTANLVFGYYQRTPGQYFTGNVDELAVFNKALTQTEVTEIYNTGTPTDLLSFSAFSNILSWWRCGDDDVSPTILDNKDAINGTLTNGPIFQTDTPP